jgi:CHRD domain
MRKLGLQLSVFLFVVLFVSLGMAADKSASERSFKGTLSGNEEVPPVKTNAKGEAKFQIDKEENKLLYTLIDPLPSLIHSPSSK